MNARDDAIRPEIVLTEGNLRALMAGFPVVTSEAILRPAGLPSTGSGDEVRFCASASRHTGHMWMWDGCRMWCNGRAE